MMMSSSIELLALVVLSFIAGCIVHCVYSSSAANVPVTTSNNGTSGYHKIKVDGSSGTNDDSNTTGQYLRYPRTIMWLYQFFQTISIILIIAINISKAYDLLWPSALLHQHDKDDDINAIISLSVSFTIILLQGIVLYLDYTYAVIPFHTFVIVYSIMTVYTANQQSAHPLLFTGYMCSYICLLVSYACMVLRLTMPSLSEPILQNHPPPQEYIVRSLFDYIAFSYINKDLIDVIMSKESLDIDDVPGLSDDDSSSDLYNQMKRLERNNKTIVGNELMMCIIKSLSYDFYIVFILQFASVFSGYVIPISLHVVLAYVSSIGGQSSTSNDVSVNSVNALFDFNVHVAVFYLFFVPFIRSIMDGQNYVRGRKIAIRVKACLYALLYSKLLRLDLTQIKDPGALNTCISTDIIEISEFACYWNFTWSPVLEISMCLILLYLVLGIASLMGVFIMVAAMPIGMYATKIIRKYQEVILKEKDERMNVISEILKEIRIIKYFTWENQFLKKISIIRGRELDALKAYVFTDAKMKVLYQLIPALVALASFLVHTRLLKKELTSSMGFTSLLLFSFLRRPLQTLPDQYYSLIKAKLSFERIVLFLNAPCIDGLRSVVCDDACTTNSHTRSSNGTTDRGGSNDGVACIELSNAALGYKKETVSLDKNDILNSMKASATKGADVSRLVLVSKAKHAYSKVASDNDDSDDIELVNRSVNTPLPSPLHTIAIDIDSDTDATAATNYNSSSSNILRNINLSVKRGSLVAISGPTGSGKTTLLLGMLGECDLSHGTVKVTNTNPTTSIAYVSQNAWIQNATIRENIVMNELFDPDRYSRIVKACQLEFDLDNMQFGDATEIGERGINLSGYVAHVYISLYH